MKNKYTGTFIACAVLLVLTACLQPAATNNIADQAAQLIQKGDTLCQQGNYDEAITEYTAAIELDTNLANAYLGRGQAYYFKGDGPRAADDFPRAINLDPNYTAAYYGRGWAQLVNQAWDGAVSDFSEAIELDPSQAGAYSGRGWAYLNKAQWRFDSYYLFFYRFENHHGVEKAFTGKGWFYARRPEWQMAAIPDMTKAMVQDPDPAEAYCNLGLAHVKEAEWARAIANYQAAIAKDPSLDWTQFNTTWSTGMKANWDPVITDYSKVIELMTKQSLAAKTGNTPTEEEEWSLAVDSYNKAIELAKDPAVTQKAKDALQLIDQIRVDIKK